MEVNQLNKKYNGTINIIIRVIAWVSFSFLLLINSPIHNIQLYKTYIIEYYGTVYTLPYVCQMVMDLIITLVPIVIVGISLAYLRKLVDVSLTSFHKKSILYSLIVGLPGLLMVNPIDLDSIKIETFDRQIGNAVYGNWDSNLVIVRFFIFFYIAVLFVFCGTLLFNQLINNSGKIDDFSRMQAFEFVDKLVAVAGCWMAILGMGLFAKRTSVKNVYGFTTYLIYLLLYATILYVSLAIYNQISFSIFKSFIINMMCISTILAIVFYYEWENGRIAVFLYFVFLSIGILLGKFSKNGDNLLIFTSKLSVVSTIYFIILSIYLELICILNQYKIFVTKPRLIFGFIVILCVIVPFFVFHKMKKGNALVKWLSEQKGLFAVIGVSCLSEQIPLCFYAESHIFESANAGVLIGDFFQYGKIPIISHYGGHMLNGVFEGIIYGIVNNDYLGAIFSPYKISGTLVLAYVYMLIKKYVDEDYAWLIVLFIPILNIVDYWGLILLPIFLCLYYIRNKNVLKSILLWIVVAMTACYRLDMGVAIGVTILGILLVVSIDERDSCYMKHNIIGILITGGVFLVLWVILCKQQGLNAYTRLREFVEISASNLTQGYHSIGDVNEMLFAWCYLILPFTLIVGLVWIFFAYKNNRVTREMFVLECILGGGYFANYHRSLVRHSVVEMQYVINLWSAAVFISILLYVKMRKKEWFIISMTIFVLLNNVFTHAEFRNDSIVDKASKTIEPLIETWSLDRESRIYNARTDVTEKKITQWEQLAQKHKKVNRINWNNDLCMQISEIKPILDILLDDEETYVDFVNRSFAYPVMRRECPVYISQSTLQLSGEYTQREFIKQIDSNGVPIILMPTIEKGLFANDYDGIRSYYRYYLISEYIYNYYTPMCKYGGYSYWVRNTRYDEILERLKNYYFEINVNEADVFDASIVEIDKNKYEIKATGSNPQLVNLNELIDLEGYINKDLKLEFEYMIDKEGVIHLSYSNSEKNDEQSTITEVICGDGKVVFEFPYDLSTSIRINIPTDSTIKFRIRPLIDYDFIDYDYDTLNHDTNLGWIPFLWGNQDLFEAKNNLVVSDTIDIGNREYQLIETSSKCRSAEGNYLLIHALYEGKDNNERRWRDGDEETEVTVLLLSGNEVLYSVSFMVKEGQYDYLIRLSSDYYWYAKDIDTVRLIDGNCLDNIKMAILQGD